ncbi:hypothetical protein BGP_6538 [Beggiatoa sp. PS]|nr:hypothetical protein BGP_6538 [Beggiatoa sp. PS]
MTNKTVLNDFDQAIQLIILTTDSLVYDIDFAS